MIFEYVITLYFKMSDTDMKNFENEQTDVLCTICGDDIEIENGYTKLACSHTFHHGCLLEMIMKSVNCNKCPNCRKHFVNAETLVKDNQKKIEELETRQYLILQQTNEDKMIFTKIIGEERIRNQFLLGLKHKEIIQLQNKNHHLHNHIRGLKNSSNKIRKLQNTNRHLNNRIRGLNKTIKDKELIQNLMTNRQLPAVSNHHAMEPYIIHGSLVRIDEQNGNPVLQPVSQPDVNYDMWATTLPVSLPEFGWTSGTGNEISG